jgi:hypothetical protein
MAAVALAGSVVAGLAGSFIQSQSLKQQAKAQLMIGEANAREKEAQGNREQAAGQMRAQLERREAESVASKARAGFGASGIDASSSTALLLDSDIIKEGEFRANIEIADAANRRRSLNESAKADRFESKVRAASSRSQATASLISGVGNAFGAVAQHKFG